jgi:hypothetical protein
VHTVTAALAHPIMRRAAGAAAGDLRRETPILLRQEDGTLLEGVADVVSRGSVRQLDSSGFQDRSRT